MKKNSFLGELSIGVLLGFLTFLFTLIFQVSLSPILSLSISTVKQSLDCSLITSWWVTSPQPLQRCWCPPDVLLFVNEIVRQQHSLCCTTQSIDHVLVYCKLWPAGSPSLIVDFSPQVCRHSYCRLIHKKDMSLHKNFRAFECEWMLAALRKELYVDN